MTDMVPKGSKKWGKTADLARELGCSDRYVRKLRENGRLVIGLGGLIDIPGSIRLIEATADPARSKKTVPYRPQVPPAPNFAADHDSAPPSLRETSEKADSWAGSADNPSHPLWDVSDVLMTGFSLGWCAAQTHFDRDASALETLLRERDLDCSLSDQLEPELLAALIVLYGRCNRPPQTPAVSAMEDLL